MDFTKDFIYKENFLSDEISSTLFKDLRTLFLNENIKNIVDGDNNIKYKLNRKTLVFIDDAINKDLIPKIWGNNVNVLQMSTNENLLKVKNLIEKDSNFIFNICLVNYYETGKNNIGWHSDNEEKGSTSCIASISLGAPRSFAFRDKSTKNVIKEYILNNGSLLLMYDDCQEKYQHALLTDKKCKDERINLTFRLFSADRYTKY